MSTLLWLALPYIALTSFLVGHVWRYRHDQFGWTTRSSQMHESRLLRMGSPLFHFGLLAVIGGHVLGLLVPKSWTEFVGITEGMYHLVSVTAGTLAGVATAAGVAILLYRRFTVSAVRQATTRGDKVMYAFLVAAIVTGMFNTVGENLIGGGYDYRSSVSVWFRGLFTFSAQPELMTGTPLSFQVHNVTVLVLLGIWPYTRLVHVFSAPVGYLVRPYVVYRSRDPQRPDTNRYARAWGDQHE
ncbi:respiratory nitrate reductase subunit gamma [Saccharothrix luteola]|uniref:respiratory nitrate reductase subunit gamma n=1 Tax=Saccharothrix luteola TaxID=2893018 RepID=UPI001E53D329|nr:respiratory nitrate reductase subunit gamma [Saccharothrix luteola]MCC8243183.1 respiratory nitrate reductase subunit gamma [Saccharothrix luteola]